MAALLELRPGDSGGKCIKPSYPRCRPSAGTVAEVGKGGGVTGSNRLMLRFFCAAPVGKQDHNGRPLGEPFGLPPQLRVTGLASVQFF